MEKLHCPVCGSTDWVYKERDDICNCVCGENFELRDGVLDAFDKFDMVPYRYHEGVDMEHLMGKQVYGGTKDAKR